MTADCERSRSTVSTGGVRWNGSAGERPARGERIELQLDVGGDVDEGRAALAKAIEGLEADSVDGDQITEVQLHAWDVLAAHPEQIGNLSLSQPARESKQPAIRFFDDFDPAFHNAARRQESSHASTPGHGARYLGFRATPPGHRRAVLASGFCVQPLVVSL